MDDWDIYSFRSILMTIQKVAVRVNWQNRERSNEKNGSEWRAGEYLEYNEK